MHRQALLVSLSLSPASTAAKNDKHWAFLDEIDAPQWADLKAEEALAKAGTVGDDPWFYRSHSHHEVPLTETAGVHAADVRDSNSNVRTPSLERKKTRGSSKAKLAFDGGANVKKPKDSPKEDESPRAGFNDTFGADFPRIASPVHCKSPESFLCARRFISSDDHVTGNDGHGGLGGLNVRVNMFENQFAHDQMSMAAAVPASCTLPSAGQSAEDEDKRPQTSLLWQDAFLSKLKDTSRLRKSLGSALRVKSDDSGVDPNEKTQGAVTLPKSRLRQSVQLAAAILPVLNACESDTTKETASLRNENGCSIQNCLSGRISPGDANTGTGLANKLGVNSSVQAFDDIRRMRKSWGSALRVKLSEKSPVEDSSSKHDIPPASDERGDYTPLKPNGTAVDIPLILDAKTGLEEENLPGVTLLEVVRTFDLTAHSFAGRSEALDSVKELEVCSPSVVAASSSTNKLFRRSVSFDHTPGKGTVNKASTSNRSNLIHQKKGSRASSVSRLNGPAEKLGKVSHSSKGGKENTNLHSLARTTKLNPEPATRSPRKSRQTVTRMSMPSLTFAAHARAAMGANGGAILKPSGNNIVETNRADYSRAAASVAKKSAGGLDSGFRKKTDASVTQYAPPKMITRQSILRSSMPAFSSGGVAKQVSRPAVESGAAAIKVGGKNGTRNGNGDADLAALLAEHNRKFRPKPTYEPRFHSVKDIREWEARTGQLFYNLLPAERERANQQITAAKQTQTLRPK